MRKADLDKYRDSLLRMKARLSGMVDGMASGALRSDDAPSVDHLADHGSDHFNQDLTLALVENEQGTIQEIDEALRRIDQKTYGACEGCTAAINRKRLTAIPHARLCVECQEKEDDRGA